MATICIICYNEKEGKDIEDDVVILAIRKAKNAIGIAKNNRLVVCPGCMEVYKQKRGKYERDLVIHAIIGGLVLLLFVLLPIFTTGFSITSLLLGLLLFALIMALSIFSHCPKIAESGMKTAQAAWKNEAVEKKAAVAAKKKAATRRKK